MNTVKQALAYGRAQLAAMADTDPDLDARVLLCHILGKPPTWLYTWPEAPLSAEQQQAFTQLLARRAQGHPIAHLTGEREFWGLTLQVTSDTLIPRPDTELLVETALSLGGERAGLQVLDLGTGSGAVALALAHERPDWQITATDTSEAALAVASANAQALTLPITLLAGHWFSALPADTQFDLIVSNPPYIAETDPHLAQGDVAYEPRSALTAGVDGLIDLRDIATAAPNALKPGGWLAMEHGWDQGTAVRDLLQANGFSRIATHQDFGQRDRVTVGQLPAAVGRIGATHR